MDRKRILIVEDSPTMRQLLVFALRRLKDTDIVEAQDGMDGLKLISLIRGEDSLCDIPIVVITTEGAKEDRERALSLGANEYLTKPIQANRVLKVVQGLLKGESKA